MVRYQGRNQGGNKERNLSKSNLTRENQVMIKVIIYSDHMEGGKTNKQRPLKTF